MTVSKTGLPRPAKILFRVAEGSGKGSVSTGTAFGGRPLVWFARRTAWESTVRSAKPEPFWHAGTKQSFFC